MLYVHIGTRRAVGRVVELPLSPPSQAMFASSIERLNIELQIYTNVIVGDLSSQFGLHPWRDVVKVCLAVAEHEEEGAQNLLAALAFCIHIYA